jgi:hypothetical protein
MGVNKKEAFGVIPYVGGQKLNQPSVGPEKKLILDSQKIL